MAQEQATEAFYDFMHGKYLLKRLYKIDLQEDDYIEDAYMVWRQIGNIAAATHAFESVVDDSGIIKLPCNAEFIESVTLGHECHDREGDFVIWYNDSSSIYHPNSFLPDINISTLNVIKPVQHTDLHPNGEFLSYELVNNGFGKSIRVDSGLCGSKITIIYRGIIMDSEGNPCVTRKESEAIAHKIAFMDATLAAYTGDKIKASMLGELKSASNKAMQAAKIPEYISQNFLDQLLASKTRHDRKVFNSSYKLLR